MKSKLRLAVLVTTGVVVLLLLSAGLGLQYLFKDPRRDIDLLPWAVAHAQDGYDLLQGAQDVTQATCVGSPACDQAVATDGTKLYRFREKAEASAFAAKLSADSHVSNWIVIEYTVKDVPENRKQILEETLDGTYASD